MGRSRGGLTTIIHAFVGVQGLSIRLKLTAGQAHEGHPAADMFVCILAGSILRANSDGLRESIDARRAWPNIRAIPRRVQTFPFSGWLYRTRAAVKRFFNKLNHFRAVTTRYDNRDDTFLTSAQLASIRIWLRTYETVTCGDSAQAQIYTQ